MAKKFDHMAWAEASDPPSNTCQTCRLDSSLLSAIADVVELIKSGRSRRSLRSLLRMLKDPKIGFNYPYEYGALLKHIRNCLGGISCPTKTS